MRLLTRKKGAVTVISAVMLLVGVMTLAGIAYAWFSGILGRTTGGGLYPQIEDFCTTACILDPDKVYLVLVPLDGSTVIRGRVTNKDPAAKTYSINYYPNFTPELSLVATTPTISVPHGGTAFAEITVKGLIARNNEVNFNITVINTDNNKDNMSFGIRSFVSTANVPDIGPAWFFLIVIASVVAVHRKSL
ncbi:MAG: hypothetical protein HY051_01800 [Candidatus Aenigmarchaeota archaeon]|nr:hypothetical protein [Candidatus Aenigmarchaeota archaeon]